MNKDIKKPSGSLISYFSNLVKYKGGINLAQGTPGFQPPEELLLLLEQNIYKENRLHQYPPGNGDFRLLELLSEHYSRYFPVRTDNVLIVQGATEGISLTFLFLISLVKGNYSVLSFDPPYESYPILSNIFKIPFEYFDYCSDISVDFEKLEDTIKEKNVRIVIIASPGNPLGKIWSKQELEKISYLSEKYDFYIIYDAVYKEIYFDFAPFNPIELGNKRIFYINSFSKMLSITGWRIGYIIAEENYMRDIRGVHDYTGLCAATLFQRTIAEYIENNNFGADYTSLLRSRCKRSYSYLREKLCSLGFKVADIQGGYFMWAELPTEYTGAFRFAKELYDKSKVGVVPGENFSPNKLNFIRLNFATEMEIIKEATARVIDFFN